MNKESKNITIPTTRLHLSGLIQGVGFRPFVYRLANRNNLKGIVYNQNNGVIILLQGEEKFLQRFKESLFSETPTAAGIISMDESKINEVPYPDFSIINSRSVSDSITQVSPDIAVCDLCLEDMNNQSHRIDYPLINCTHCGPRFSIIENIPYDRPFTSMKNFEMCPECQKEYKDITDRRFHAQPVACNNCGPVYSLHTPEKKFDGIQNILQQLIHELKEGKVIAMKGLGGYHLACDVFNPTAIEKLRQIKLRDGKPFAIMAKDLETCKRFAVLSETETEILTSWQRPILLASKKENIQLPFAVTNGLQTLGIFLPYLPFHHLLFEKSDFDILVMTSANISECPIITDNEEALQMFLPKGISVLDHNRDIVNRVDDSIVQEDKFGTRIIRRARGYTPNPVFLNLGVEGILATGAELTGAFCIGKENQAIMSQFIGDLKNMQTLQFFEQSYQSIKKLFKFSPLHIACDMHPDYLSTDFAHKFELPVIEIQHHHAHIASCMAEYGLDEKVIGIAYDGTGFGTDGKIWGSEIMVANLEDFERKYHFEYIPVPGGDLATKEPWRSALAYLYKTYDSTFPNGPEFLKQIPQKNISYVKLALEKNLNSPESCSAGRLFDAISALLSICPDSSYHAEAPLRLEHSCNSTVHDFYTIDLQPVISWRKVIRQIIKDLDKKVTTDIIASKFHNTVAEITKRAIVQIHEETGITKVILSGGTFQNKYLVKKIVDLLTQNGFEIYLPRQVPPNDGGIALGQLAIAAKKINLCV